jgi:hypothetical protein
MHPLFPHVAYLLDIVNNDEICYITMHPLFPHVAYLLDIVNNDELFGNLNTK